MDSIPTLQDIRQASDRISPFLHKTAVMCNRTIDEMSAASVFFKCENFQKVGAFKARGALNAVLSLDAEDLARGVATHSSGNHAAALAFAAAKAGTSAYIVLPENAPRVKKQAVAAYGADITYCEPTLAAREESLAQLIQKTGANFIPPFNDYRVICGQATAAMELIEEVEGLDMILAPVGGGGLLSGTALSAHYLSPGTRVIAAEPEGADDACRSFQSGRIVPSENPQTIADGLLTSLGELTFGIIMQHVHDIVTVDDLAIVEATQLIMERMKVLVEPSAAVCLAALMAGKLEARGKRVGIILSGGNIDISAFIKARNEIISSSDSRHV